MHSSPSPQDGSIAVRPYDRDDAADTLAVFLAAITETAAADYTSEQIQAWADPDGHELQHWHSAMAARFSFVATIGDQIAGFSDVGQDGYIDMMFVSPHFLRRGVARTLLAHGEETARWRQCRELTTDASITARPFFERYGFTVVRQQSPVKRGVTLTNFRMRKSLGAVSER